MIEGRFGDEDELIFEIDLMAIDGFELPIDVVLDTGFSDWLVMDEQDLEDFDWEYVGKRDMRMAKGEAKFDVYAGKVRVDGQIFEIPVYAGKGVSEVLLGRQWLKTRCLLVDMSSGVLNLGE
jgi:predicted aspartyl protease